MTRQFLRIERLRRIALLRVERLEQRTLLAAVMVKDFNVNPADAAPDGLTAVGDSVFFTANDESTGQRSLWKTDGTEGGTVRVSNRPTNISEESMTAVGDRLFFFARGGMRLMISFG